MTNSVMIKTRTLFILFTVAVFLVTSANAQFLERDCKYNISKPQYEPTSCRQWIIQWRLPNGKVWGAAFGQTRAEVERQRDNSVKFQQEYAAYFKVPFDERYSDPSDPICDACLASASREKLDSEDREILWKGLESFSLGNKLNRLRSAYEKGTYRPFPPGSLIKTYEENVLNAAILQAALLRKLMSMVNLTGKALDDTTTQIGNDFYDLFGKSQSIKKSFDALPNDIKQKLDSGIARPSSTVAPVNERKSESFPIGCWKFGDGYATFTPDGFMASFFGGKDDGLLTAKYILENGKAKIVEQYYFTETVVSTGDGIINNPPGWTKELVQYHYRLYWPSGSGIRGGDFSLDDNSGTFMPDRAPVEGVRSNGCGATKNIRD